MQRYRLTIEYNGSGISGWQRQDGSPSVQQYLEEALGRYCDMDRILVEGAGRTDSGVHARGMTAHVDLNRDDDPDRVIGATNHHLESKQITVTAAARVSDDFHARFSCIGRRYLYRILARRTRPALEAGLVWHVPVALDVDAMQDAANLLLGKHDFSSFRSAQCQAASPVKTLDRLDVVAVDDEIHLHVAARSFLHNQVRIFAGTLKTVGEGKWSLNDVQAALDAKDRTKGAITAPPHGLYFMEAVYPDDAG